MVFTSTLYTTCIQVSIRSSGGYCCWPGMQIDCIKINWSTPGTGSFVCSSANKHNQVISNEQLKTTKHSKGMSEFPSPSVVSYRNGSPTRISFCPCLVPSHPIASPAQRHTNTTVYLNAMSQGHLFFSLPHLTLRYSAYFANLKQKQKTAVAKFCFTLISPLHSLKSQQHSFTVVGLAARGASPQLWPGHQQALLFAKRRRRWRRIAKLKWILW